MKEENKKLSAIEEYYKQRKEIMEHIRAGGSIDDLDPEEYGFKQPL